MAVRLAPDTDADGLMNLHADTERIGAAHLLPWAKSVMSARAIRDLAVDTERHRRCWLMLEFIVPYGGRGRSEQHGPHGG
ncbi:MAG: hypothetical protein AB7S55_02655 [Thiomonas sp.]